MDACIRCGLCLEACPTYVLTRLEEEGPRLERELRELRLEMREAQADRDRLLAATVDRPP